MGSVINRPMSHCLLMYYLSPHCLLLSRNTMKQELILQKPTPSMELVYPRVIMGQSVW